jgi:hypothetical protein
VVVATVGGPSEGEGDVPRPDDARAYVDAWRRSQQAVWKVDMKWERQARGSRLEDMVRIAQRPPDRLVTGAGSVDARRGDRALACAEGEDGRLRCRDGGPAPPYEEEVARGVAVLEQQLLGPRRLYDVTRPSPNCYEFRLRFAFPAPPFGRRATLCFDEATGAPTLREIERAEGRDRQQAIAVSGRVDDTDLAPPPGEIQG